MEIVRIEYDISTTNLEKDFYIDKHPWMHLEIILIYSLNLYVVLYSVLLG